jgi:hypothetical protein
MQMRIAGGFNRKVGLSIEFVERYKPPGIVRSELVARFAATLVSEKGLVEASARSSD